MPAFRWLVMAIGALVLAVPVQARAGTVARDANAITYQATATTDKESVAVGVENGMAFVTSERGATSPGNCTQTDPNRVDCPLTPAFVVLLLGFDDSVVADLVTGLETLEAHGGAGGDSLSGTPNADRLFGDEGGDSLEGKGGNDQLDGGPGDDTFYDGPGEDTVTGGPGNDTWHPGPGRDSFSGGVGGDRADYGDRTAPVTITLNDQPDDGESGEGDNVASDVEDAIGGSGNDRIVAGPFGTLLRGGGGNDTMTGSPGEDRIEGEEGDDTIDSRDGRYDSIDCGPGNDVVLADPGDGVSNCEVAPDRDGDGYVNEADCAPDDPAVHPGAGEVFGNPIDEDCANGPGYFQVDVPITFKTTTRTRPARVRFVSLRLTSIRAGDKIELRCKGGKKKGCPFTVKRQTGAAGKPTVNVASLFKKRFLRAGAVVEIRVLRANQIGKVLLLTITKKADVKQTRLCLGVGATTPGRCPTVT
jgi:hypothetical protein